MPEMPTIAAKGECGMTIRIIVADWLESHGYDGLYLLDLGGDKVCDCHIDDLAPHCNADWTGPNCWCIPGYRHADGLIYLEKENP